MSARMLAFQVFINAAMFTSAQGYALLPGASLFHRILNIGIMICSMGALVSFWRVHLIEAGTERRL